MIKLKINLRHRKPDKDGLCPIAISIREAGKETFYNTGIKVHPDHFRAGTIVKPAPNYDIKAATVKEFITNGERFILTKGIEGAKITIYDVKEYFKPNSAKGSDFYSYAENLINTKKEVTKKRYTIELDKIKAYAGETLKFGEVTPVWLSNYRKHLLTKEKKNTSNTTINAFKVIRHVFNEAREHGQTSLYPFDNWKYPVYEQPVKQYLTMAQCNKIFDLLDKSDFDYELKLVSAFFLLECFSGIRVSDWGKFSIEKMIDKNDMIFTTTKTDTPVRLPLDLMPSLARIVYYIRDNHLKWSNTGEYANTQLKSLGRLIGVQGLTTHRARHTAATLLLSKGMSREGVGQILGITIKMVDTYAHLTTNKIREELTRIGGI